MADNINNVSDANFENDVLGSDKPVLVDFWAQWCGPCKAIAPVLEDLAVTYKDKISVAKVDVDANPATPQKFGIKGIPTLILFKNGQVVDQIVGNVPKDKIEQLIQKA
ncbi:MAG: thioredoxin [Bdellovibrionota bacterium]|nr:thioredoxin [Deltaproteobacteria bacterium]